MTERNALAVLKTINQTGSIVLRGTAGLASLREAIAMAMKRGGVAITFEPDSEPDLSEYLAVSGLTALDDAIWGAMIGALIGAAVGRPAVGLAVGAGLGAAAGAARGVSLVHSGWRIRAMRGWDGTPLLTVMAQ